MKYNSSLLQEKSSNPNLSLKDFLRQVDLNKNKLKKIESSIAGHFQSTLSGPGFDFNEIREYKIGDDLRHISWSTTAKTGKLHTKEYFSEKEFKSLLLIDISNSMFCGEKFETFIKTVAFVLNLTSKFSEKVGAIFFKDDIKYHFPLSHSSAQTNIIFETLLDYYFNLDQKVTGERETTNIFKAIDFTRQYFSKKGIIFIISDFINLYNFEKIFFETASKQNTYLFQIYDEIDYELPKAGYITIFDPETKEHCTVNTDSKDIHAAYAKATKERQEKLDKLINLSGAHHFTIRSSDI
jgi:uncharacterized protein (DUF58 family)